MHQGTRIQHIATYVNFGKHERASLLLLTDDRYITTHVPNNTHAAVHCFPKTLKAYLMSLMWLSKPYGLTQSEDQKKSN